MRRFIDVVFVNPKGKYYVVLHKGKFWQLPRMNLAASSWVFKLLYNGSLNDIFIAKNQALACQNLIKILKTYELPAQLTGMSAARFLDWWQMNDYKILSQADVMVLDAPALEARADKQAYTADLVAPADLMPATDNADLPSIKRATTQLTPAAKQVFDTNAHAVHHTSAHTPNNSTPNNPTSSKQTSGTQAINQTASAQTDVKQPTPNNTAKHKATEPKSSDSTEALNVFDDLLHQLNEEVMHHHG